MAVTTDSVRPAARAAVEAPHPGADLRALRKSRQMTLAEASAAVGRSVGWLSQIERGLTEPSLGDLRHLVDVYGVPLGLLFRNAPGPSDERAHVVRRGARHKLGSRADGFLEELLSPDLGGAFEVFRSEFAPGAELAEPVTRKTEEAGYVVSGRLDLMIGARWHRLDAGDSFRFSHERFRWRNTGREPAVVIWIVSPPIY